MLLLGQAPSRQGSNRRMPARPFLIGLISDTHGLVRPEVARVLAGADLIVHAGDVGGPGVLAALAEIAPVEAVSGNVDDANDPRLARDRVIPVGGLTLHVSHGHELGRPTPELLLARYNGDVLVFGHTHRPVVAVAAGGAAPSYPLERTRVPMAGGGATRIVVNPGAAGPRRFDLRASVATLTIATGSVEVEIIALGS